MLGATETKDEKVSSDEEEEQEPPCKLLLPYWSFIPGDGKFYLFILKPLNSTLSIQLNHLGDMLNVFLCYDNMEEIKETISKALDFRKDFLNTLVNPYTEHATIVPPFPLINPYQIHLKNSTQILISFPIKQHDTTGPLVF